MQKILERINVLAKIAKERELSSEELKERDELRKEYIKIFRSGLEQQLKNVVVLDEFGNDVTPK
ncbi:DUF896 domain-containing protein [Spiroplasma taiwanense]|uniref:Uncharacterized protein n=1 Tax=Spiroplasma taiwanense CT-1 TaxID=1276220 RepID=S5MC51_9MOLU|nr:DUF896 domain-containing protein [Spiroplasma taiwanense]AGR41303.1 hypothetical protein STAIW_v1c06860 [Spiroplasma taiwanense CT-1]